MEFSYKGYLKLCQKVMENGYQIKGYHAQETKEGRECILRHDIDFSLEKALEMAYFENKNGICSIYLFLVSSDQYNIFSRKNRKIIREIQSGGHTIGLHFDESVYEKNISENKLISYIQKEKALLECVVGETVDVVSMHEPSGYMLDRNLNIPGMINTYSEKYFHEYKYLSDSMMCWREDVETIIKEGKYQKLHILTHPFWYQNVEKQRKEILESYIKEVSSERKKFISRYYPEITGNEE